MGKLSYVVVSTPRSATGWASQALSAMGPQCGHDPHVVELANRYGYPG